MTATDLHELIITKLGAHWGIGTPQPQLFLDDRQGELKTHVIVSSDKKMPCRVLGVAFISHATKTTTKPVLFRLN